MSNMKKVLVLGPMHEEGMKLLRAREDVTFEVLHDVSEESILKHIDGVNGLAVRVAQISRKIVEAAPAFRSSPATVWATTRSMWMPAAITGWPSPSLRVRTRRRSPNRR